MTINVRVTYLGNGAYGREGAMFRINIVNRWPAMLIGFGLVITICWWVLLGWLVSGPLERGMLDLIAVASSPTPAEAEVPGAPRGWVTLNPEDGSL